MKKLINEVHSVVPQALAGTVASANGLCLIENSTTVLRSDFAEVTAAGKVAIISGGGSGHEPAHAGFVGMGMLTAAVAGDVFASPSTDAVLQAIRAVAGPGGVLLIVKNYTGDRLNFGLAAQMAEAEGIETAIVVVDDDCALGSAEQSAGRRGIAGTVLIHKIAGAAADAGRSLGEVKAAAEAAVSELGSIGVALSPCIVPAAGSPNFELADHEMEIGLGIHGEAGLMRAPLAKAHQLANDMIARIVADRDLSAGDHVVLLVNNLGATPPMELSIMAGDAIDACHRLGLKVCRVLTGTFLTAIDMAGVSLSLMRVDEARLAALDAGTSAPAWVTPGRLEGDRIVSMPKPPAPPHETGSPSAGFIASLDAACAALIAAEAELTRMDQIVGDGDIGRSLAGGAQAIQAEKTTLNTLSDAALCRRLGEIIRASTGGTSGPLYAILAFGAGHALINGPADDGDALAHAFAAGVMALRDLGGAEPGDRTMVDALVPAAEAMARPGDPVERLVAAASAARAGAEATARMKPRRGRSSYLGDKAIGHPDPGAMAVALWLEAAAGALSRESAN